MSKTIIQVLGPTGVGKSRIALHLAQEFSGEIISADSMQVYKDFDIGTDKLLPAERLGIPHYLIDLYSNCSQFNTSIFLREAHLVAGQILADRKLPIVCGGTALYLKIMINGIFPENQSKRISREKLKAIAAARGLAYLFNRLQKIDPPYAAKIGPNDQIRIIRALEIYYNNGIPPSEIFKKTTSPFHDYHFIRIGLNLDRDQLYQRIEARVERMIARGFLAEVQHLKDLYPPHCPPFKSLGYKEMLMHLNGQISFKQAVALMKQHTRNFAKRQLSWFRQETDIQWFQPHQEQDIVDYTRQQLAENLRLLHDGN